MPNHQIMPSARDGGRDGHIRWLWQLLLYGSFLNALINNSVTRFYFKLNKKVFIYFILVSTGKNGPSSSNHIALERGHFDGLALV